jgi:ssRNA-specific RNase YbeY (16S rRNA maturation enzyme)
MSRTPRGARAGTRSSGSLPRREWADRDLRGSQSTRHLPSPNRAAVAVVAVLVLGLIGLGARAVTGVLVEQARQGATAGVPALSATSTPPSPTAKAEPSPPKGTARRQAQNQAQATGATRKVPNSGPGTYVLARVSGDPAGRTGTVVNFDVRREKGVPVDVSAAARTIQSVLNDRRSWRASDKWRFQLVSNSASADLHVYITTPATTDRMCAPLLTRGEVSCQTDNRVVLNAKRWVSGAESYGTDLTDYRRYLVNHEFGHALGYQHVPCEGKGRLAGIMMQQTKGLDGCRRNPWPFPQSD